MTPPRVILASGSKTRHHMLTNAGLTVETNPPRVDEAEVKAALYAEGASAGDCAEALAELKALRIARRAPEALVIGADQMLVCEGQWFDKPVDREAARKTLLQLRGKTHQLVTCVVIAHEGRRIWHHLETADLSMRQFSDHFLEGYLDAVGDRALESVGAYQLESVGAQLFNRVKGDHFTILGLPLLPLLDFLRSWNVVNS